MPTKDKGPKLGAVVTYKLSDGGEVPALVTATGSKLSLTVFALTGPYVAHDVPKGTKPGTWHG